MFGLYRRPNIVGSDINSDNKRGHNIMILYHAISRFSSCCIGLGCSAHDLIKALVFNQIADDDVPCLKVLLQCKFVGPMVLLPEEVRRHYMCSTRVALIPSKVTAPS